MKSDMSRRRTETEKVLLSKTETYETLFHQTHTKPQETLEIKLTKPRESFSFKPSIILGLASKWMIGLTILEVYNSFFKITEENNKFELCIDNFDEISFEELKDELERNLSISVITPSHFQHEMIGPRIIQDYNELRLEKSSTDGFIILLLAYARSPFRDFESFLRIVVGLDETDIHLILKQYISSFVTYELSPGIYSIEDFSEVVYTMGDHEGTLQIEYNDMSMKAKLI